MDKFQCFHEKFSADYDLKIDFFDLIFFSLLQNLEKDKTLSLQDDNLATKLAKYSADKKNIKIALKKKNLMASLLLYIYKYTFWYKTCYLSELQRTHGRMQAISKFDKLAWLHFGYCVHIFCTKKTHIHLPFTLGILIFIASDWFWYYLVIQTIFTLFHCCYWCDFASRYVVIYFFI